MDASEYLPLFLTEAREHLLELNTAVLTLERTPDDRAGVDALFRVAHTLKGMSATMGFNQMAALTHAMEDALEVVREGSGLPRALIDDLFECLDTLESMVDEIEADGEEAADPAELVGKLRAHAHAGAGDGDDEPIPADPDTPGGAAPVVETLAVAGQVPTAIGDRFNLSIVLGDEVDMPAVRAMMAIAAASEHATIVRSDPSVEQVETFTGRRIELLVALPMGDDPGPLVAAVRTSPFVDDVRVCPVEVDLVEHGEGGPGTGATSLDASAPRAGGRGSSTVRVDAERLDQLMHAMGELVVHRTRLESLLEQSQPSEDVMQASQDLARSSQALHAMVMVVRMVPVDTVFARFPRLVRDLSKRLAKDVELVMTGGETEVDRSLVDSLADPLVHLIRNALDHGIEVPEERASAGKEARATLEISARHAGSDVLIAVRDDGRGVDAAHVARIAVERGLIEADDAASITIEAAIELLFQPGFSTAAEMTDVSGRGVGMDAVRAAIRSLGGDVRMRSQPGIGTSAEIRLPLTLAIQPTLLVKSLDATFAVPTGRVIRTLLLSQHKVQSVGGHPALVLDDEVLPVIALATALGRPASGAEAYGVITRCADRDVVLAVDELTGQRELVVRPLPAAFERSHGAAGAAVLPDGEIAIVIDCEAVAATRRDGPVPTLATDAASTAVNRELRAEGVS